MTAARRLARTIEALLPGPARYAALVARRLGRPVLAAVPLTAQGSLWARGPTPRVLLALTADHVFILALNGAAGGCVGGVVEHLERDGVVVYSRRSRLGGHAIELSWPERHALIAGVIPNHDASQQLLGHLASDELGGLRDY